MELITKYSAYMMPLLMVISSIATGIIFIKNKSIGNALLFTGFIMHAFPAVSVLIFNISPVDLNEASQTVRRTEGFLSFYQFMVIELMAYSLITLGFVLNAYALFKK